MLSLWSLFRKLNKGEKKKSINTQHSLLSTGRCHYESKCNVFWLLFLSAGVEAGSPRSLFAGHVHVFPLQPAVDTYQRRVQPHGEGANNTAEPPNGATSPCMSQTFCCVSNRTSATEQSALHKGLRVGNTNPESRVGPRRFNLQPSFSSLQAVETLYWLPITNMSKEFCSFE